MAPRAVWTPPRVRGHWLAPAEADQELAYEALRLTLAPIVRRMLGSVRFEGLEHVPAEGAALIVSNHRSAMDPLLIGLGVSRHLHFVAEGWLGRLGFGSWLEAAGVLFLPRRTGRYGAFLQAAGAALESGELVALFPEGMDNFRRVTPPGAIGSFHQAFARLWWRHPGLRLIPVGIAALGAEWRIPLPARWFGRLAPCDPRYRSGTVWLVGYREALVRVGEPWMPPRSHDEDATVRAVTADAERRVRELLER